MPHVVQTSSQELSFVCMHECVVVRVCLCWRWGGRASGQRNRRGAVKFSWNWTVAGMWCQLLKR